MANQSSSTNPSKGASTMAELMAKSSDKFQVLTKGQIIEGTIKKLTPTEILMDIGAKGDALVIEYDKQNLENLLSILKVGDRVKASVISPESEEGFPVVSLRRMLDDAIFARFEKLTNEDKPFEIAITESSKGGYFGQTDEGVKGFLPSSQVTSTEDLVGTRIKVKILEVDRSKKRIVFSQKALNFNMNLDEIRKLFKVGDKVEVQIAVVTTYGMFVVISKDSQSVEGFVHISEVSYERVENLSSRYKAGEKIEAQVIEIDSQNKRVNLSIKRTLSDTFAQIEEKYKVEQKIRGIVAEIKTRGITLKIEEGINGFIPSDKVASGTTYEVGQKVDAEIVEFDKRRRVIILSPILKAIPIGYR